MEDCTKNMCFRTFFKNRTECGRLQKTGKSGRLQKTNLRPLFTFLSSRTVRRHKA